MDKVLGNGCCLEVNVGADNVVDAETDDGEGAVGYPLLRDPLVGISGGANVDLVEERWAAIDARNYGIVEGGATLGEVVVEDERIIL